MVRIDHNFSITHSLFARYTEDDSSALVPYVGTPPGTYVPGFPAFHLARNQYGTVQDRTILGDGWSNDLRFGVNRTTASSSIDNTHPGLSVSLLPDRPFGMIDIPGMSLLGNSPIFPIGDFSTVYQVQDQVSRTIGRHTLKFGVEFRRLQENGPFHFAVNGLYSFADLTPYGLPASSNNPALEFFLQGLPLAYVGVNPSSANTDRGYPRLSRPVSPRTSCAALRWRTAIHTSASGSRGKKVETRPCWLDQRKTRNDSHSRRRSSMPTFDLIGSSPKFLAVMTDVERVAPVDSAVLIQGETGTGKEMIARAIHEASPRRRQRFMALNCGRFRARCWRANCSATKEAHSRARAHKPRGDFRWRTGARSFWTRSAACRWNFSPNSYAPCRNGSSNVWAAPGPSGSTCGW